MRTRIVALMFLLSSVMGSAAVSGARGFTLKKHLPNHSIQKPQSGAGSIQGASAAPAPIEEPKPFYFGWDVEVDPSGVSYVVGGEIYDDPVYQTNGWLAKYDKYQVIQSSVVFSRGTFYSIVRDTLGNIYVAGEVEKEVESDAGTRTETDILIVKYDSSLKLLRTKIVGGLNSGGYGDSANALAFAPNGDLMVVGYIENKPSEPIVWCGKVNTDNLDVVAFTYESPEIFTSKGNDLVFDGQGNIYIAAEMHPFPLNYGQSYTSAYILKYDAGFNFINLIEVINQVGVNYEPIQIAANKTGDFIVFGERWDLGAVDDRYDTTVSMWVGKVSKDFSKKETYNLDPTTLNNLPSDMALDDKENVYLSGQINKVDEKGLEKSLGWVVKYSPAFVQLSSVTISGSDPHGDNAVVGLKILNNDLYMTGAITNTDGITPYLKKYSLAGDQIDPSDPPPTPSEVSEARVYPSVFQPLKGHTYIRFDRMPVDSTVRIYSMTGGLVKEIRESSSSVNWDVKNDSGDSVASGVYFVRVSGSGGDKTFKIVVQR
ncbi:MAG: T9SS type A sorting domain-containing protein [Elusimicrobia bacterium]|nr:T9SS type A sorting domain-containing protein [Elusimicrobiota bacterium]